MKNGYQPNLLLSFFLFLGCSGGNDMGAPGDAGRDVDTDTGIGVDGHVNIDAHAENDVGAEVDSATDGESGTGFPNTPQELEANLLAQMKAWNIPGLAACIVKDGGIPWCDGFGMANIEEHHPVTHDTAFLLASVSKTVTATGLMQLRDDGHFDLDDAINNDLNITVQNPNFPDTHITYRMALSHVSSIKDGNSMHDFYVYNGEDPVISLEEAVVGYFTPGGEYYDATDNFYDWEPGTNVEYSNMAIALLGYVGEVLSGEDFRDYCANHIFIPLGMSNTSFYLSDFDNDEDLAMPYTGSSDNFAPAGHYHFSDYPNGGLRASAYDMAKFVLAYANGGELNGYRVLETATIDEMFEVQYPSLDSSQGLVWYYYNFPAPGDWVLHQGGEAGVFTEIFYRVGDGLGFVILMNGQGGSDYTPLYAIEDHLFEFAEGL